MTQAIMLSVQPKWCQLIAEGKKTIECRKDVPGILRGSAATKAKVYIYCTKARTITWRHPKTGERMDGRVVGEFICDDVFFAKRVDKGCQIHYRKIMEEACLTEREIDAYSKGADVYGWHISGFRLFESPIPLSDFGITNAPQSWVYTEDRTSCTE